MEFKEKLQCLRKQKGLTQEELAAALYVSRTAISKWESGRGYPNIDSLKAIAKFFDITVDQLLSGDQLLTIAEEDTRQKRDLVFGLLDIGIAMLLFLPFFGQKTDGIAYGVSMLALTGIAGYLKTVYYAMVFGSVLTGVLMLALQNCKQSVWLKSKCKASLIFNGIGALLFVVSQQPYAAVFLLAVLTAKVLILTKKQ